MAAQLPMKKSGVDPEKGHRELPPQPDLFDRENER
jgi:hypothetical protein